MLVGFGISILLGMALPFVMTAARWLERSLWPYLVALQAVPILVISPVLGSIFGYKENTRVIVCVIISIVPIVSNTLFGLRSVERGQHDLFTLQGVSSLDAPHQAAVPRGAAGDLHRASESRPASP